MEMSKNELISRRLFMLGTGSVLASSTVIAPRAAQAIGSGTEITGIFDVTEPPYNAPGTGSSNAQPGIQAAINAASANGGGIVWLPPGIYRLDSQIVLPQGIILAGSGWTTPLPDAVGAPNNSTGAGSWISITSSGFNPIRISGRGASVRDIAFIHQQPTNIGSDWAPANYPYTIDVNAGDNIIENVFFRNATRGIIIRGAVGVTNSSVGRVTLKHIWGQPIVSGIDIDNALDVVKIDDVHFWPFWSYSETVSNYQRYGANYAFTFKRCDNPHLTNIFVLGYRRGFYFTGVPATIVNGYTQRFLMSNCGTDFCPEGIYIDAAGTSGAISNYYSVGGENGQAGIHVSAANALLQCSNIRISAVGSNAVRVSGAGAVVAIENIFIEAWNQSNTGFPAIECISPATLYLGHCRVFLTNSGPQIGGTGTINLD